MMEKTVGFLELFEMPQQFWDSNFGETRILIAGKSSYMKHIQSHLEWSAGGKHILQMGFETCTSDFYPLAV